MTAARAEAAFQDEMATKQRNMADTRNDLFKQMRDHRRATKIENKKKQKHALELRLLDKLDTEMDRVQTTTQRLRDLEVQHKNNRICETKEENRRKDMLDTHRQEKAARPWIDEQNLVGYKERNKDFFLMEKRKERQAGGYEKFAQKFD